MVILNSCCCWNNVRNGSIACGVYTLVVSLLNGGLAAYNLVKMKELEMELIEPGTEFLSDHITWAKIWHFGIIVVAVMLMLCSVLLIIAIHMDNRFLLIPWITVTILMVITDTAVLIFLCVAFGFLTFNIILMAIWLGLTVLNIYCTLCVISQYQELKAGRGTLDHLRQQRAAIIYQPAVQEVRITQGPIVMTYPGPATSLSETGGVTTQTIRPAVQTTIRMGPLPSYPVVTTSTDAGHCYSGSNQEKHDASVQPPTYVP